MPISIDHLRRQAKMLRRDFNASSDAAKARVAAILPDLTALKHADALRVVAREAGHASWPKLKVSAELAALDRDARAERLKMALFFGQNWVVERLLADDPGLGDANLGLQIALLRFDPVADRLAADPHVATRMVGIRAPILHLTFSQHWRHVPGGAEASIALAEMLVAAGADVNASYPAGPDADNELSALYGALGHAGNLALAEWLLEHGADPDDNESLYHSTELGSSDGLKLLLKHGARIKGTNALLRAMDFDSIEMVQLLLDAGADPNEGPAEHPSGQPPVVIPGLHQAARRMCSAEIARALIVHGADGTVPFHGHTAYAIARMRGNHAVAQVLEEAGQATSLDDTEALLGRAADGPVEGRVDQGQLTDESRRILTRILGFDDTLDHVKRLIALGIDPNWTDEQDMPAIHIAAWEGHADAVEYLLGFDPDLRAKNMYGGDLMGTAIHGAEFCPARARRDHMRAARAILEAGSLLHRHDINGCGVEPLRDMLEDWSEAHPDRVVEDT